MLLVSVFTSIGWNNDYGAKDNTMGTQRDSETSQGPASATVETLMKELKLVECQHEKEPSPHWRRILVRSAFAAMDGLSHSMMRIASPLILSKLADRTSDWWHGDPDSGVKEFFEICALSNMTYEVNDKGEIDLKPSKTNLARQMLFAIRMMAKANGTFFNPKGEKGWSDFVASVKVRDRVTHPKRAEDLNVTDAEVDSVRSAMRWLVGCNRIAMNGKEYESDGN